MKFAMYGNTCLFVILQDQLSADLYNFASKEGDYARYYVMVGVPQFSLNDLERKWKYDANMVHSTITVCFVECLLHYIMPMVCLFDL